MADQMDGVVMTGKQIHGHDRLGEAWSHDDTSWLRKTGHSALWTNGPAGAKLISS